MAVDEAPRTASLGRLDAHLHQRLGILHRQHSQQHSVEQLEYRGVGPNAERQGQQCNRGKTWIQPQKPNRMAEITGKRLKDHLEHLRPGKLPPCRTDPGFALAPEPPPDCAFQMLDFATFRDRGYWISRIVCGHCCSAVDT